MADADATQPKAAKAAKKKSVDVERKPIVDVVVRTEIVDVVVRTEMSQMTTTSEPTDGRRKAKKKKKKKKQAVAIVKKNKKKEEEEATLKSSKDKEGGKKKKKVYDLPGQKHHPPSARDPLRVFYETLHEQVLTSEMAAVWMMERGLLPEEEAKKVYERKLEKGAQQNIGTPIKAVTVKKSGNNIEKEIYASDTVLKTSSKKRKSDTSDSDDDFVMSKVVQKAQ
ncbi:uncharacterized protein LOC116260945 isoform X2 [Nymphaea colorata]|uniref:uncharacterized protein LOC116260945 isoform X2 n=1 Tax=Nymphaea colorata TaxID=210225 RepID=UPI00129E5549|nr:uncharacterized protein LOC116260945 isoform X2 [Nymphaea colorata]